MFFHWLFLPACVLKLMLSLVEDINIYFVLPVVVFFFLHILILSAFHNNGSVVLYVIATGHALPPGPISSVQFD